MSLGIIGTKSGMTRVFTEEGESVPVTVLHHLESGTVVRLSLTVK